MKEAIIATISTVIGTLIGWLLANIKTGKLNIQISDVSYATHYTDPEGCTIPEKAPFELYALTINFNINLHNSSAVNKAIRDCTLVFLDALGNDIFQQPVYDLATRFKYAGGYKYNQIEVENIDAYKSQNIKAEVNVCDIDSLQKVKSMRFKYKNERFNPKEIKCKQIDFSVIPIIDRNEN